MRPDTFARDQHMGGTSGRGNPHVPDAVAMPGRAACRYSTQPAVQPCHPGAPVKHQVSSAVCAYATMA
jgi:hypothetical protein